MNRKRFLVVCEELAEGTFLVRAAEKAHRAVCRGDVVECDPALSDSGPIYAISNAADSTRTSGTLSRILPTEASGCAATSDVISCPTLTQPFSRQKFPSSSVIGRASDRVLTLVMSSSGRSKAAST